MPITFIQPFEVVTAERSACTGSIGKINCRYLQKMVVSYDARDEISEERSSHSISN